jgi:hypothetical protein
MSALVLSLLLLVLVVSSLCPVHAFYSVVVPRASARGSAQVPDSPCVYLYSCVAAGTNSSSIPLPGEAHPHVPYSPVYVGTSRSCRQRINQHKCAQVDAVYRANDLPCVLPLSSDSAGIDAHAPSVDDCIVRQCQGDLLILQYYLVSGDVPAAYHQAAWLASLSNSTLLNNFSVACNTKAPVDLAITLPVDSLAASWITVPTVVSLGPFGASADTQAPLVVSPPECFRQAAFAFLTATRT